MPVHRGSDSMRGVWAETGKRLEREGFEGRKAVKVREKRARLERLAVGEVERREAGLG